MTTKHVALVRCLERLLVVVGKYSQDLQIVEGVLNAIIAAHGDPRAIAQK